MLPITLTDDCNVRRRAGLVMIEQLEKIKLALTYNIRFLRKKDRHPGCIPLDIEFLTIIAKLNCDVTTS